MRGPQPWTGAPWGLVPGVHSCQMQRHHSLLQRLVQRGVQTKVLAPVPLTAASSLGLFGADTSSTATKYCLKISKGRGHTPYFSDAKATMAIAIWDKLTHIYWDKLPGQADTYVRDKLL